jgi:hypothetical protein
VLRIIPVEAGPEDPHQNNQDQQQERPDIKVRLTHLAIKKYSENYSFI